MNVLIVLHGDLASNSGQQVHLLANELCRLDCDVAVVIDGSLRTFLAQHRPLYRPYTYPQAQAGEVTFVDGGAPAVVHAWTPREKIRKLWAALRPRWPEARLIVHLEDNEDRLLQSAFGKGARELRALAEIHPDTAIPDHLSHPVRYPAFLASASGVTLLIETLGEFAPAGVPVMTFWPAANERIFYPRPYDWDRRRKLRIPDENTVVVYTGNVHQANAREVRSLYLAVALLNREGHPATIIRTGTNHCPFLGEPGQDHWCDAHEISLGPVAHEEVGEALALADILVQPGADDAFNRYRFPSKLPEFFAMGKPVVLPATNLGLHTEHRRHAYVLPRADALSIAGAVREIRGDAQLRDDLARGAAEFAAGHFSWRRSAEKLFDFYGSIVSMRATSPAAVSAAG